MACALPSADLLRSAGCALPTGRRLKAQPFPPTTGAIRLPQRISPSMKSLIRTAFTAAFPILLALPARALAGPVQGPNEKTPVNLGQAPAQHASTGGSGGSFFRMLFGLLVVVGVIYGVYWLLKKVKAGKEERASGRGLSTIATLPLGPNR